MNTLWEFLSSIGAASLLSAVGLATAALGVVLSAHSIARKRQSEHLLIQMVKERLRAEHKLRRLRARLERDQDTERQIIELYEQYLVSALARLPDKRQRAILEGLKQPSERGRRDYLRKLMEETVESGSHGAIPQ